MSFSYNRFLRPLTSTDRNIQILDDNGVVKFTINPFSVINVMVSNNLLKISSKGSKIITISFSTSNEAKLALEKIQIQLDILKERVPVLIDKQIENYVNYVLGESGTSGSSGSSGTSGIDEQAVLLELQDQVVLLELQDQVDHQELMEQVDHQEHQVDQIITLLHQVQPLLFQVLVMLLISIHKKI